MNAFGTLEVPGMSTHYNPAWKNKEKRNKPVRLGPLPHYKFTTIPPNQANSKKNARVQTNGADK